MLTILIIIAVVTLAGLIVYDLVEIHNKKRIAKDVEKACIAADKQKKREELIKQAELEYEIALGSLIASYGDYSLDILLGSRQFNTSDHVYFFEQGAMMVLQDEPIPFEKIIGFSLNDNTQTIMNNEPTTSTTTTSTGNVLGRALVGGVLLGGVGALAGATTAKKKTISAPSSSQTTTIRHKYTLYLNIDCLSNPIREIELGGDTQKAQTFANAINVITQRNKK